MYVSLMLRNRRRKITQKEPKSQEGTRLKLSQADHLLFCFDNIPLPIEGISTYLKHSLVELFLHAGLLPDHALHQLAELREEDVATPGSDERYRTTVQQGKGRVLTLQYCWGCLPPPGQ